MKNNKNNWMWWIILGAIVVFVLLPKTGFLGSLLTICDNTEPSSITGFGNSTATNPTIFNIPNGTISFITNTQGNLKIVIMGANYTCPSIYSGINGTNGAYGLHNYKIANGQIYWCNKEGTLLLYTSDPNAVASYYTSYEVCRTQNYTGTAYEADPAVCVEKFGNWTDDECVCPDGTRLKINAPECEQETGITPDRLSGTCMSNIDCDITQQCISGTCEAIKITTPTSPGTGTTTKAPDRTIVYVLGGLAVAAIGYFAYASFFKKKKRGR
jgi:hypothetical protein